MQNLAGYPWESSDRIIERELVRAGIGAAKRDKPCDGEVSTTIFGQLGAFVFDRSWRYWRVAGLVPIEVAEGLYVDPVGRTDIRVNGDCTCPSPLDGAMWILPDGRQVVPAREEAIWSKWLAKGHLNADKPNRFVFNDQPAAMGARRYVNQYHIDTEVGLRVFADSLKRHHLAR